VELELSVSISWDRSTNDVVSLVISSNSFEAGHCGTARALKRVAIEKVDSTSVVESSVVIFLVVVRLVPVVDAVEKGLQVSSITLELETVEIAVSRTEKMLAVEVLNVSIGPLA